MSGQIMTLYDKDLSCTLGSSLGSLDQYVNAVVISNMKQNLALSKCVYLSNHWFPNLMPNHSTISFHLFLMKWHLQPERGYFRAPSLKIQYLSRKRFKKLISFLLFSSLLVGLWTISRGILTA